MKQVKHSHFGIGTVEFDKGNTAIVRFESGLQECLKNELTCQRNLQESIEQKIIDNPLEVITRVQAGTIMSVNDTWGLFACSKIALLPHQLWVCHRVLRSFPANYLIADDVGLGKTIEAGLILMALLAKGWVKRFLIICPASLVTQWQIRLREMFDIRTTPYTTQADTKYSDFWSTHKQVVASLPTLRMNKQRHERLLEAEGWDLLIVDEAHHLYADKDSGKTLSYQFVEKLLSAKKIKTCLFFTGTPHRGKNYGFLALLHLLKPERFNPTEPMLEQLTYLHDTLIRNNKQNVVDMKGNKLFKPLQNTAYTYQYSLEEEYFYQQMTDFISSGKSYASTLGEQERKSVMLVLIAMQKLASSSVAAIHKALKGRLDRLKQQMTNLNQEIKKYNSLNNLENIEEFDELAEKEETLYEKLFPDILTLIANEIPYLEELIKSAENIKQETKIQTILDLVEHQFNHEQILFFTEYKATQALLMSALIRRYGEESATFINGDERLDNIIDFQGKIKTIHRHRSLSVAQFNEGKVRFIISTEAGGEGIDLQNNCHVLIHIDLPWNPMRLHQRVGRLNRYGQKHPVQVITIRNPETVESLIWEKLNAKLNNIMLALSEVMDEPEDLLQLVLGMTQNNFFTELFSEASSVKKESLNKWFDQKTNTFGGKNILETVKTLVGKSAQFDLQDLASIPQKDLQELQPFFETMLHLNKRRFSKENNKISFKTPEKWLVDAGIKTHYEELMFYRYLKEETKNIIGVGNRVFDLAIQQASEHDAYLTFIKKLEYPLIVFRVYDRVTETSGNIKQVFFGVLLNKQTPQVLLDWQLLEIMNTFLKDNHEKLDLDYDLSVLKKYRLQAKILLENQLPNFKLPFKVSEISELAMFCPINTFL